MHDSSEPRPASAIPVVVGIYALALALWTGGLLVLGAVVAPTVFRIVPAPTSADAMLVVFRKFDVIAIGCAIVALVGEALLAWRGGRVTRADVARGAAAVVAAILAVVSGAHLSPAIAALHQGGAVRGFGDAGRELERLHHLAETAAKAELLALVVVLVLLIARAHRPQGRSRATV